jgi:hypothetical protein
MSEEFDDVARDSTRWSLMRDVAVLQVKLVIDGLRDLLLVPASLIVGLISLVKHENGKPGPQFYDLLNFGRESERRINLFGAYSNRPMSTGDDDRGGDMDIDDLVSRVESYVVDEVRRGGINAQAKAKIDQALDAILRKRKT